jgi:hypothetical protein
MTMGVRNEVDYVWRFIDKGDADACWRWTGSIDSHGYGRLSVAGKSLLAHRIVFRLTHHMELGDLLVCHTCDNRACCNPAHLFAGTPADNLRDAVEKGRMPRGEKSPRARLTTDDVKTIRGLAAKGQSQRSIASHFGVTQCNVSAIVRRLTWRHV